MNERRIARLQEQIKQRVAEVVAHEMADPRIGLITITRVKLDRELAVCKVYWSIFGDAKHRRMNEEALQHGRKYIQHEVAGILHTRTVPQVRFLYDESVEGAARMQSLLNELRAERERTQGQGEPAPDEAPEETPEPGSAPDGEHETEGPEPRR